MGKAIPGGPTLKNYRSNQPSESVGVVITSGIQGTATAGDVVTAEVALSGLATPPTVAYTVLSTDTLTSIVAGVVAAIQAAITAATAPWNLFSAVTALANGEFTLTLASALSGPTTTLLLAVNSGSTLLVPAISQAENTGTIEVTALSTFAYSTSNGATTYYQGQRILVPTYVALDMFSLGLVA